MIQRVQSILLFLASVNAAFVFFIPFVNVQTSGGGISAEGSMVMSEGKMHFTSNDGLLDLLNGNYKLTLFFLAGFTVFMLFMTIFQYKNRALQMKLCSLNIVLLLGVIVTHSGLSYKFILDEVGTNMGSISPGISFYCLLIAIVLTFVARRYIKKDEALVRSADRLR